MAQRLELQTLLEGILGSQNVYFQPPPSVEMNYPCIVYSLDYILSAHADGAPYKIDDRYLVTVIDRNPDSAIPRKIAELPKCTYDRSYVTENLNHYVFKLFF